MRLWIGNLDPNTTDDELREFIAKYSKFQITGIERHPGDGSRPAVMRRLHGMYWNKRQLHVAIPSR